MTRRGRSWAWGAFVAALFAVLVFGMVKVTGWADRASKAIRSRIEDAGPAVTLATFGDRFPGIPVKPGMTLDEAATNNPLTRLLAGLHAGGVKGASVAVFRTTDDVGALATWYSARMPGWRAETLAKASGNSDRQSRARGFTLRKEDFALTILLLPEGRYRGQVLMVFRQTARPGSGGSGG